MVDLSVVLHVLLLILNQVKAAGLSKFYHSFRLISAEGNVSASQSWFIFSKFIRSLYF